MTKLIKTHFSHFLLIAVLVLIFLFSLFFSLLKDNRKTRFFIFPSVDSGSYIIEKRKLDSNPVQGELQLYIDEILLGSCIERTKLLFSQGTKVEYCFLRGNTLYLNLSDDLLNLENNTVQIDEGIELLKKNIYKNFKKINKIELFIAGKYVSTL